MRARLPLWMLDVAIYAATMGLLFAFVWALMTLSTDEERDEACFCACECVAPAGDLTRRPTSVHPRR